jgi:hypothetical protein
MAMTIHGVNGLTFNDASTQAKSAATGQTGAAPFYAARAWVNFNGTTSPGTIRSSGNVSSVSKNGTGNYTLNFTNAMPDADYVVSSSAGSFNTSNGTTHTLCIIQSSISGSPSLMTTTQVQLCSCQGSAGSFVDNAQLHVAIFR